MAGSARLQYPAGLHIVRVICSGMVPASLVMQTLTGGADGVLLVGCHPGDCRHRDGNLKAEARAEAIKVMVQDFGLEAERFRLAWISASEGSRFAQLVRDTAEQLQRLGPNPYRAR